MTDTTHTSSRGNRRIDRVLAADYLDNLAGQPLTRIRELRDEAEQEETDLSYIRRLLQGRIDILRAELGRRSGSDAGADLVGELPQILSEHRGDAHGLGRHKPTEPSRLDQHRRRAEALVADVDLADVSHRSDAELDAVIEEYVEQERMSSASRRRVQGVVDACSAEIARRYRDGEADVTDLLNR